MLGLRIAQRVCAESFLGQLQTEFREPLPHLLLEMVDVLSILETHHEVRRPGHCSPGPSRPGDLHPEPLTDSGRKPLDLSGSCHP